MNVDGFGATVELSYDELVWTANALNESFEHLETWEFETRTGAIPKAAEALRLRIGPLAEDMRQPVS